MKLYELITHLHLDYLHHLGTYSKILPDIKMKGLLAYERMQWGEINNDPLI